MKSKRPGGKSNPLVDILASTAGLSPAKFGSDDKHEGYIVKQNSVLKCILLVLVAVAVGGGVLLSTVYELKIAKRGLVHSETYHLKREKHDHKHLMNLAVDLQQSLGHNLESAELVEEFRAIFGKLVGNHENRIHSLFQSSTPESLTQLKQNYGDFNAQVDAYLSRVITTLQRNNQEAKQKIHKLSELVVSEINSEARQDLRYADKLEELEVDEDYANALLEEEEEDGEGENGDEDDTKMDEENDKELTLHMDHFFTKLKRLPTVTLDPVVLTQMELAFKEFDSLLEDETKDADLDLFAQKMYKLSGQRPAAADGKESVVQFYAQLVEMAKLAPHKQNLFDLYNGWKTPHSKITVREVLAEVQNVAQKSELMKVFELMDEDEEGEEEKEVKKD
ncbi:hypothetical protein BASA81_008051 [Batrachochytrium salamandrivorans]|nr:hypothetical protein BASA81_008051 [Batrachochytrium salamandrivorans]